MKALALALVLLTAQPTRTATTASPFTTELERDLWATVVLLEGDTETATRALAACEIELARPLVPTPRPAIPTAQAAFEWHWPIAVLAALASGIAFGLLLDSDSESKP